jgi:hypothetical protein
LPQGFTRVGYDADSGRHYFRDSDGALWEGPEGASYGEMTKGIVILRFTHAVLSEALSITTHPPP